MDSTKTVQDSSLLHRADDYARREPTKAVVSALGAGFLIHLLPWGAITALAVSLALALLRPVLLFLGLVKACELCGVASPQNTFRD